MAHFIATVAWPPPRAHFTLAIPFAAIVSLCYACFVGVVYIKRLRRAATKGKAASSNALGISFEESDQLSKDESKSLLQNLDGFAILSFRCLRLASVAALVALQVVRIFHIYGDQLDYALLTNYVSLLSC